MAFPGRVVPKIRALFEATYFAGLRKAGMPEESPILRAAATPVCRYQQSRNCHGRMVFSRHVTTRFGAGLLLKERGIPDLNLIKQAEQGCELFATGSVWQLRRPTR